MTSANISIDEATAPAQPLLEIKDLAITFKTGSGEVKAVKNAHLTIMPGETVAIVGESGSGKSTTALAAIGLLPNNGRVSGGQILLEGEDIAADAPDPETIAGAGWSPEPLFDRVDRELASLRTGIAEEVVDAVREAIGRAS